MITNSILTALGIHLHKVEPPAQDGSVSFAQSSIETLYEHKMLPITASMLVDDCTLHPFGKLSGGASLALAECLAGYASRFFCKEHEFPTGLHVSGNHIATANKGERLLASAHFVHKGSTTHVWNVDITNEKGRLISSVRVTNMILSTQKK